MEKLLLNSTACVCVCGARARLTNRKSTNRNSANRNLANIPSSQNNQHLNET